VTGGWRKLHNEELHGLYSSPSIVRVIKARRMRWAGHVSRQMTHGYKILAGKPEEKVQLGIHGSKLKDNIKMDLKEIGCGLDLSNLE
jgi:hypothetical protein